LFSLVTLGSGQLCTYPHGGQSRAAPHSSSAANHFRSNIVAPVTAVAALAFSHTEKKISLPRSSRKNTVSKFNFFTPDIIFIKICTDAGM